MGLDRSTFRHSTLVRVRNYEIDWQGIVHNANYLLYCELGRIAYFQRIGIVIDADSIRKNFRVVVVRNEIDYLSPARFGDELEVFTRISSIRTTSFVFEGIIEQATTHRPVAENVSVHVWLDPATGTPARVEDDFRRRIRQFEERNVRIEGDP